MILFAAGWASAGISVVCLALIVTALVLMFMAVKAHNDLQGRLCGGVA